MQFRKFILFGSILIYPTSNLDARLHATPEIMMYINWMLDITRYDSARQLSKLVHDKYPKLQCISWVQDTCNIPFSPTKRFYDQYSIGQKSLHFP